MKEDVTTVTLEVGGTISLSSLKDSPHLSRDTEPWESGPVLRDAGDRRDPS